MAFGRDAQRRYIGAFTLGTGLVLIFVISPLLTYRHGKRWYCSWVCGCGALAETAGDPFRQLSSKKMSVWKLERWMVHGVLVFVTLTTLAVLWTLLGSPKNPTGISQWAFSVSAILFSAWYWALFGSGNVRSWMPMPDMP